MSEDSSTKINLPEANKEYAEQSTHSLPPKRSSIKTVFNLSNAMMGSALLVAPCNFYTSGLVSSVIISVLIGAICFWTSNLIVMHSRDDEYDYNLAVKRIVGKKWERTFNGFSALNMLFVGVIYFVLVCNITYSIIISLSGVNEEWPAFDEITFSQFSMQYIGLIYFVVCYFLYNTNNIDKILKLNEKGVYFIFLFMFLVIYLGIDSLNKGNLEFVPFATEDDNRGLQIVLFNSDLSQLIGVFSMAYSSHSFVCGIMKSNKDSSTNAKVLGAAYFVVFLKYTSLGVFGSFAVAGLYNAWYDKLGVVPKNMMVLLNSNNPFLSGFTRIGALVSMILVAFQLLTVLPIIVFTLKRQFFDFLYGSERKPTEKELKIFNIGFNLFCLAFEMAVFEPMILIAFKGSIIGFVLIYIIPIYCHLKCLYIRKSTNTISPKTDNGYFAINDTEITDKLEDPHENELKTQLLGKDKETETKNNGVGYSSISTLESSRLINEQGGCRKDSFHQNKYSPWIIFPFYLSLTVFGVLAMVSIIYNSMFK